MEATIDHFKQAIQNYLEQRAQSDELFAPVYANPKKSIDDCIAYIINTVQKTGRQGFADDEIYSLAMHYYDEPDMEVGKPINCKVVVNQHIELTDEEKLKIQQDAMKRATDEAYAKIKGTGKSNAKKVETTVQPSLF